MLSGVGHRSRNDEMISHAAEETHAHDARHSKPVDLSGRQMVEPRTDVGQHGNLVSGCLRLSVGKPEVGWLVGWLVAKEALACLLHDCLVLRQGRLENLSRAWGFARHMTLVLSSRLQDVFFGVDIYSSLGQESEGHQNIRALELAHSYEGTPVPVGTGVVTH